MVVAPTEAKQIVTGCIGHDADDF